MTAVLINHRELATDSNSVIASCIRFTVSSSYNFWSSDCQSCSDSVPTLVDSNQEDQSSDRLKDTEPLATLGTLTSDVEELVLEISNLEVCLSVS